MGKLFLIWILLLSFALSGLGANNSLSGSDQGIASYYGNEFVGRKTASGEIYLHERLTAAHRYLPFGTRVLVTHLNNQKKILVTINDRGPFVEGRIIDLSKSAAEKLGMISTGIAKVLIQVMPAHTQPQLKESSDEPTHLSSQKDSFFELSSLEKGDILYQDSLYIQVGAFRERANAYVLANLLKKEGFQPRMKGKEVWRVFLAARDHQEAKQLMKRLFEYDHRGLLRLKHEPSGREVMLTTK